MSRTFNPFGSTDIYIFFIPDLFLPGRRKVVYPRRSLFTRVAVVRTERDRSTNYD